MSGCVGSARNARELVLEDFPDAKIEVIDSTAATVTDDMILDERSKELFGEGQRFFDMIRMNRTIVFNDDFQDVPVTRRAKTIDRTFGGIVLPIPQDEINANAAIADQQNEYYK